jgi:glycosyltransferase involved in cell wall biosynthesis
LLSALTEHAGHDVWTDVCALVPAHNSAQTIERTLSSVAGQRLRPAKTIVVDDGSSDDTAEIAERSGAETLRLSPGRGAAAARNAGLRAAATPFCAFLDADDAWEPDHLGVLQAASEAHPDCVLWFSGSTRETDAGQHAGRIPAAPREQPATVLDLLTQAVRPTTSATLVSRQAALSVGGFNEDPDYRPASCEDLDLWLRLAARSGTWALPTTTARYLVSDQPRDRERLAANERARLRTVRRALLAAGTEIPDQRQVWAATWRDLGLWRLKHGDKRGARRCFMQAYKASPADLRGIGLGVLTLAPDRATRALREAVRASRRRKDR